MKRRDLSSVKAVGRVQTLDGSAVVLRVWRDASTGWEGSPVRRLTPDTLEVLREDGVRFVRLRRHRHVGEVSLSWFPAAHPAPQVRDQSVRESEQTLR